MDAEVERFIKEHLPSEFYSPDEIIEKGLDGRYSLERANSWADRSGTFDSVPGKRGVWNGPSHLERLR